MSFWSWIAEVVVAMFIVAFVLVALPAIVLLLFIAARRRANERSDS